MVSHRVRAKRQPGLPDPASVIEEIDFTPSRPQSAPRGGSLDAAGVQTYKILRTTEMDPYDRPAPLEGVEIETLSGATVTPVAPPTAPPRDTFSGTSRKAAKLSIGKGAIENMADLQDLINSLPADQSMIKHTPPISDTATSRRATEENRNVQVQAFLYASSREADNDFHLIIGRDRQLNPHLYMTAEVSGLPTRSSASYATLNAARNAFKQFFGKKLPGQHYDFYDPPIPVLIEGSILFDIHHAKGPHPGPPSLQANMPTIWELHPVTKIVFEP